jgi:hypothetical protein
MASGCDVALERTDADLLAAHAARCADCRTFAATLAAITAGLPALAESDPGPGFSAAVFARTSRRPADPSRRDRWRAAWQRLVERPRFAWEAAYVVTLCWLLFFGHPIAALDWTTARVSAMAREDLPLRVQGVQTRVASWRDSMAASVDRAAGVVAGERESARQAASAAQRHAATWWTRLASDVAGLLQSSWRAMVAWVNEFLTDVSMTGTEPSGVPARSSE